MEPLLVTATMAGRVVTYNDGLHLDGILAGAAFFDLPRAERDALPSPDLAEWLLDFDLPLERWAVDLPPEGLADYCHPNLLDGGGRLWGWKASAAIVEWEGQGTHAVRRRTPLAEVQRYATDGKLNVAAGRFKPADVPYPDRWARALRWYCVGDRDEILRLLRTHIPGVGKLINHGAGRVLRWDAEPADADHSIVDVQGNLARRMPDWWWAGDGARGVGRIRPPYAHRSRDCPCVEPMTVSGEWQTNWFEAANARGQTL